MDGAARGDGNGSARALAARSLDAAGRDPGFFYLVGHGVPEAEVAALHALARQFFALPQPLKDEIAWSRDPESGRGYQRLGENVTMGRRDWHEAVDFYAEPDEASVDLEAFARPPACVEGARAAELRRFVWGRNQWPASLPAFRRAAEAHFARMTGVGQALMRAMAEALGLPEAHFEPLTDRSFWCARVIGYPPLPVASAAPGEAQEAAEEVGASVGEHTDYGCWTILAQDSTPGALEVRRSDGAWTTVEPVPGAFVVNLGDMLSVWTRRRFAATPHRVRQRRLDRYRTSIAFFYEPNFDAVIQPLDLGLAPTDRAADGPAAAGHDAPQPGSTAPLDRALRGGSLLYGEHLFAKVSSNCQFLGS